MTDMKGKAKRKVLTSGRLTGAVSQEAGTCESGPAYSLYSTDSEDQVTTLHKGLDRCAALLNGMLQVDSAVLPATTVKNGAAKSRLSTSHGKKAIKRLPAKTDQKPSLSGQRKAGNPTLGPHRPTLPLVKKPPRPKRQSTPSQSQSVLLSVHQSSSSHSRTPSEAPGMNRDPEEDDLVPVRDVQSATMMSQPELERRDQEEECCPGFGEKNTQVLLRELKTLIAGQGSVAERLLTQLEQTLSSSPPSDDASNFQNKSLTRLSALQSENTQLHRRVRTLNQQLKEREKAERRQNTESLCSSDVAGLREDVCAAQSRLQDLHVDLTDLRKALQDTERQLREREAENAVLKTDLEATRRRMVDIERERSQSDSLAQQRLEEIRSLSRLLQDQPDSSCPAERPAERVAQYLMSLQNAVPEEGARSLPAESTWLERSARSTSTFDTRDEVAFRDGLAALDASIASLQKTIQLDLKR